MTYKLNRAYKSYKELEYKTMVTRRFVQGSGLFERRPASVHVLI